VVKTKKMKRRKFLTQLTLASLGLPFIPEILKTDFQAGNFNCLKLGNMALDTKEFFIENESHFEASLSKLEHYFTNR
jgi:PPE-repeat protein